jgi:hypothetical protein
MFTDSLAGNLQICEDLITGLPGTARPRAARAAQAFENLFNQLRADNPKDPAIALGAAFAVFKIAEGMIDQQQGGDKATGLIQLLS